MMLPPTMMMLCTNPTYSTGVHNEEECGVMDPQSRRTTNGIKMDKDSTYTENKIQTCLSKAMW